MTNIFQFALDGAQANAAAGTGSAATGTGFGIFETTAGTLTYRLTVTGLDFGTILPGFDARITADTADDVTTAHIHDAARGANGGVAFAFLGDDDLTASLNPDGSWTMSGVWESDEGIDPFATGFGTTPPGTDMPLYFNIHTTSFGGGEIRGQIVSSADDTANTITGTTNNDTLPGLGGNDTIDGLAGDDRLEGGAGNDSLIGGEGNDTMIGGPGNDVFHVDSVDDVVTENAGEGSDRVTSSISYTLSDDLENLILVGDTFSVTDVKFINGTGNDSSNTIGGNFGANRLEGLGGADNLVGQAGNDTLSGGDGDDTLFGGLGDDSLSGGEGTDFAQIGVNSADIAVVLGTNALIATSARGVDTVMDDVEHIQFNDQTLGYAQVMAMAPTPVRRIYQIAVDEAQALAGIGTGSAASGTGFGIFEPTTGTLTYRLTVTGLDFGTILPGFDARITDDTADDVTNAHIHEGARGEDGPPVFAFLGDDDLTASLNPDGSWTMSGVWESGEGIDPYVPWFGTTPPGTDMPLNFNIHTTSFGGGEIRGQIVSSADDTANTITGTTDNDTLPGLGGNDTIDGLAGDDRLEGGAGDDSLIGGEGDDDLLGDAGDDTMVGGLGDDVFVVTETGDSALEQVNEGTDTVVQWIESYVLGANVENLVLRGPVAHTGTGNDLDNVIIESRVPEDSTIALSLSGLGGNDVLGGGGASDTLLGGDGDDRLNGFGGIDSMVGGLGDDLFTLSEPSDIVVENAGEGNDTVSAVFDVDLRTFTAEIENFSLAGSDADLTGIGTDGDNSGVGSHGSNNLQGLGGHDTLQGLGGDDTLLGGDGDDELRGGDGDDSLTGEAGDDTLFGETGADTLSGGQGNDSLRGGEGVDTAEFDVASTGIEVAADAFNLFITSAEGVDTVHNTTEQLQFADQTLTYAQVVALARAPATPGDDVLEGTAGNDTIDALDGNDSVTGLDGDDSLVGGNGQDTLNGGNGDDTILGGPGVDVINGGAGNDSIVTGDGADGIYLLAGGGNDTVSDFDVGTDSVASAGFTVGTDGEDRLLTLTDGSTLTLAGVPRNYAPEGELLLTGEARVGEALTADASGISDRDGMGAGMPGIYWLRDGVEIEGTAVTPDGDGLATYTLTDADVGAAIAAELRYTDAYDTAESVRSNTTTAVEAVNSAPVGAVEIIGTARVGETLEADTTGLSDADGLGAFSYTWLRDGQPIDGAAANSYSLVEADLGSAISLRVTYTDGRDTAESVTSSATGLVEPGPLLLEGTPDDDVLVGAALNDTISGVAGNDRLIGNEGGDQIDGGIGADTLNGGDGDDTIIGGPSGHEADQRDVIFAGSGDDRAEGGGGNDQIFGQEGNDTLDGGFGADDLLGQDGNDAISGGALSDLIFGGAGDDFVNGGFGYDRINGGDGADRFFHLGVADHGSDWVQDYDATEGDMLVFGQTATADQFQVNLAHTATADGERSGDDAVQEAFVIYRPSGQIMWALVDGEGQSSINLQIGGELFDLLA
ncbi:beta strand repeat-containing protein [Lutimaribacter marinistellae]|uniref:Beta strand repeat-containing protein n=1 Tax=Lutimaribacter marinistellae TaxID=1820329 RepID=A0ABV7TI95_9RHOB